MVLLLASNHWAGSILMSTGGSSAMNVPFKIGKWIFFGCIIFSFLLLLWEAKKSRAIIRSRDISYAFTNVMAVRSSHQNISVDYVGLILITLAILYKIFTWKLH
jgi:uncharacterized membrane protein